MTFVCEWILVLMWKVKKRSFKKNDCKVTITFCVKRTLRFFINLYLANWPVLFPSVLILFYFLCKAKKLQFEGCFNICSKRDDICITVAFREALVFHKLHCLLTRYENLDWIYGPLRILFIRHPTLQIPPRIFSFISSPVEVNTTTKGCNVPCKHAQSQALRCDCPLQAARDCGWRMERGACLCQLTMPAHNH